MSVRSFEGAPSLRKADGAPYEQYIALAPIGVNTFAKLIDSHRNASDLTAAPAHL